MTDAVKPLACPFCGGTKVNICATDFDGRQAYAVSCLTKECHGGVFALGMGEFPTPEEAIAAWDRRTPPAGWKLVPVEPTPEMVRAANAAYANLTGPHGKVGEIYRAMLNEVPNEVTDKLPGFVSGVRSLVNWHTKHGTMHLDCASDFNDLVGDYPDYSPSGEVINESAAPENDDE